MCYFETKRRNLIFYPNNKIRWIPEDHKSLFVRRNKDNSIRTCNKEEVGSIHIWDFVKDDRDIVIFCHGTNGNITQRKYVYDFCKMFNLNLILFDYFGYGQSSGKPTEHTLYSSSKIALDYCHSKYKNEIIIWGESLGGTTATYLATQSSKCKYLILMSTFSSLYDLLKYLKVKYMNDNVIDTLSYIYNNFPTKKIIKKVKCPVVIIHSEEDELISIENAKILFNECLIDKKKLIIMKGIHTKPTLNVEQFKDILDFCKVNYDNVSDNEIENIVSSFKNVDRDCFLY